MDSTWPDADRPHPVTLLLLGALGGAVAGLTAGWLLGMATSEHAKVWKVERCPST